MKDIAIEGCEISLVPPSIGTPANIQITTPSSTKVKAGGSGAYSGNIAISISGYSGPPPAIQATGHGKGTITGTAIKTMIEGKPAVLMGDNCNITITAQIPDKPFTTTIPVVATITNAGQTKVKGS